MKFLLEFVGCCGSSACDLAPPQARPPTSAYDPRKRGRTAAQTLRSKSAAEWQPSLYSISEDTIPPAEKDQRTLGVSDRMRKRKTGPAGAGSHVRSYSDDFGRNGYPAILPAFSAAPFLF
ncbi:uncharacterized protein LOC127811703 [Diospyros lotus]|uniref:uncharacterized protein LOC127811703 n=1 Tax=Diospyros lotus TaxID=55363 RepID=UPI002255963D|nr:uncharacterized protein LOC127811703 [Diospyros lotus]